jgi:hypothetical protein
MNINIEVNLKIRASEGEPEEPRPRFLDFLLHRIASHPCIVMILREIIRTS